MSEVDYSSYSRVVEPIDTTRRTAKPEDSKLAESVSQVKPIVQPQSVRPTATTAPPPESQTVQDLEMPIALKRYHCSVVSGTNVALRAVPLVAL